MRAVFGREVRSYFVTPVGYAFILLYTLLCGVMYVFINIGQHASASMNLMFSAMQLPFCLIAPLLTMRLFAEEKRMRTDQLLFTAPVRIAALAGAKLLAALFLLAVSMGLTLLFPLLISAHAQIAWGQIVSVYVGYFLLGAALLSVGLFLSALCENQVSAAVLTLGVNVLMYLGEHYVLPQLGASYFAPVRTLLGALPMRARLADFANGLISPAQCVYFVSFCALMLFLTTRVLHMRRFAKG